MKLVVTLLVRDEIDIIAAQIEHHLDQGASMIIATDNGSIDGTTEVLKAYANTGVVDLLYEPSHVFCQDAWVTRMARMAAIKYEADWVINTDADEFWVPKDHSRRVYDVLNTLPNTIGTIVAKRVNLTGAPESEGPWLHRLVYRDQTPFSERGTPLMPKVMHRGDASVHVAMGNHSVSGSNGKTIGEILQNEPIEILHLPMRSYAQFERKIRNGGSSLTANKDLSPETGWHWRIDYERFLSGTLKSAYLKRCGFFGSADTQRELPKDTWLETHLLDLQKSAVLPHCLAAVTQPTA